MAFLNCDSGRRGEAADWEEAHVAFEIQCDKQKEVLILVRRNSLKRPDSDE
jgi:hypothetical protein